MTNFIHLIALLLALMVALSCSTLIVRILVTLGYLAAAPIPTKRNALRAFWAGARWRWLTRNLGLAYVDPHAKVKYRAAFGPTIGKNVRIEKPKGRVRYPRVSIRPDRYGLVANVKTIPKVGRVEFEKQADHFANAWHCVRVQVSQPKPGRLIVRGLRRDPLAEPFGPDKAPVGVYTNPHPFRPYIGRDEWAQHRYLDLSGVTGVSIGGLPGYGKTSLILSWLHQLAGSGCVQFVFIDGKGGGDYDAWADRAWLSCGDELPDAANTFDQVHTLMRNRLANVVQATGYRNAWHRGPTPDFPLIVTIVDECHTFLDLEAVKSDKQAEAHVRQIRYQGAQLVKKGRSVLFLTIWITQKQTSDAIPTAIRDICGIGFSFACKTKDAAIAGLGEAIRQYPSYCPTGLQQRPTYIGVTTASLPTGTDPFVRLRVPEISEAAADQRARETAGLRRDPTATLTLAPSEPWAA